MTGEPRYTLEECKRLARAEFDPDIDYLEVLKVMIGYVFADYKSRDNLD